MKLNKKCAVITGASCGFGYEVAKHFVKEGANVVLCARNRDSLNLAKQQLNRYRKGKSEIHTINADVSQIEDVKNLIEFTLNNIGTIDVLVSNAGVYGPKGPIEEIDWQDWSDAIDINLKGTVLVCKAVVPIMKKNKYGKIILLSGGGATKPMPFLSSYAASKAAVVRFGETLALELKDFNIDVNSIAPGALNTRLLDEVLEAGPDKVGKNFYEQSIKQKEKGGAPLSSGAELCVYLSSEKSDGITGKLISAIWDPWKDFQIYFNDLNDTDIYTLRRIIPKERNMNWGDK